MTECPNGCDLAEFGGTHQGLPGCPLQPSNPDHRGHLTLTEDERMTLLWTIGLLEGGTSNSLDPLHRRSWAEDRDTVVLRLKEMAR